MSKDKPAIANPIYWIVALAVVILLKWEEISGWF